MYAVIINESHKLFPEQSEILGGPNGYFRIDLFDTGLSLDQLRDLMPVIQQAANIADIVVTSPFPALFVALSKMGIEFSVFHNDNRVAKEIPDGKGGKKLIHAIAETGWQLVSQDSF